MCGSLSEVDRVPVAESLDLLIPKSDWKFPDPQDSFSILLFIPAWSMQNNAYGWLVSHCQFDATVDQLLVVLAGRHWASKVM